MSPHRGRRLPIMASRNPGYALRPLQSGILWYTLIHHHLFLISNNLMGSDPWFFGWPQIKVHVPNARSWVGRTLVDGFKVSSTNRKLHIQRCLMFDVPHKLVYMISICHIYLDIYRYSIIYIYSIAYIYIPHTFYIKMSPVSVAFCKNRPADPTSRRLPVG